MDEGHDADAGLRRLVSPAALIVQETVPTALRGTVQRFATGTVNGLAVSASLGVLSRLHPLPAAESHVGSMVELSPLAQHAWESVLRDRHRTTARAIVSSQATTRTTSAQPRVPAGLASTVGSMEALSQIVLLV